MTLNRKLSAMTLNEMLVVIILSSIVMSIAFSVLSMVQKHMWSIQKNITLNTELIKLEQSLWLDFRRYNTANCNAAKDQITLKSEKDTITYFFSDSYIVKDKDTFNIPIKHKTVFFNGTPTLKGKIDALKLELDKTQQGKTLFIYKYNDAAQFIN